MHEGEEMTAAENNNKILMFKYMCNCVAPSFAPVCLPAFGSSWTFSVWSHDFQGLEHNNAALLWADWDLLLELSLIVVTNSEMEKNNWDFKPDLTRKSKTFQQTCRQTHVDEFKCF